MMSMRPWAMAPGMVGVLLFALAGIGQGQVGIGGPGEGIKLALLRLPAVQKELDLTAKQKAEIARIGEETKAEKKAVEEASKAQNKAKGEAIPKGFPDPAREARDAAFAELESRTEASLKKILDVKQRKRLSEIALQVEGPSAFLRPELIKALNIEEIQLEQIQNIVGGASEQQDQAKAIQKRSSELGTVALEKVSKEQQKVQLRGIALKISKKAMSEIGQVLYKNQKLTYARMLGETFNLAGVTDDQGRKLFDEAADMASILLRMAVVREELKLTPEQAAALDRDEPAIKILKPSQRIRLAQITLQSEGASSFLRPDLIRSLKLNEEQIDQIGDILDGLGEARRQLRDARKQANEARKAAGELDFDPALEKTRKEQEKEQLRTDADKLGQGVMSRIASVLTRAQRDAFRKQLGEPFDLSKLRGVGGQADPKAVKAPGN